MTTGLQRALVLLALVLLVSGSALASEFAYAVGTDNTLYSVNLSTATKTAVGPTGVSNFMEGLALSPGDQLFSMDFAGNLYSVSQSTGAATLVGNTGKGNSEGLVFNGSTLLGVTFTSNPTIFSIDPTTGAATDMVNVNGVSGVVRAMTLLDSTHVLVVDDSTSTFLESIDLTTGTDTTIGTLGPGGQFILAMTFGFDGNLYALDSSGNEYIVDPATAGLTTVGSTGNDFWLDMTMGHPASTTPEPATLVLTASGLAVAWQRRRKTRA